MSARLYISCFCVVFGMAVLFSGCVLSSTYPFYTQDVLVDVPGIDGFWQEPVDDAEDEPTIYWLNKGELRTLEEDDQGNEIIDVRYFRINEQYYMDQSIQGEVDHVLYAFNMAEDILTVRTVNTEWLREEVKAGRIDLPYESEDNEELYTATPEQWVSFLEKHQNDPSFFDEDAVVLHRIENPLQK